MYPIVKADIEFFENRNLIDPNILGSTTSRCPKFIILNITYSLRLQPTKKARDNYPGLFYQIAYK